MSLHVAGIGTALPEHTLGWEEAAELHATFCLVDAKRARTLRALYRRSGVRTRRSVVLRSSDGPLEDRQDFYPRAEHEDDPGPSTSARMAAYEEHAPALALRAARSALERAATPSAAVTHLVTVSCTGFVAPGVEMALLDGLGLPPSVERTHVGFMGCHGALNGLRVARSFVEADAAAVPLVCAVELCSLHFAYGWDPEMLVANALFADGAAALVGCSSERAPWGRPTSASWRVAASGTVRMSDSAEAMSWRVGDHGFRMTLSADVPERIEAELRPWLCAWLSERGLAPTDIATWAVHPGGPRILTSVESALGLAPEANETARAILAERGNMSSPTILFILERLRAAGAELPCVALAFGPGLAVEATLFL